MINNEFNGLHEAYHITKNKEYAVIAEEIFSYVLRDMKHEKGGFFSAEDADSEGEEGTFYLWKEQELLKFLAKKTGVLFLKFMAFLKMEIFMMKHLEKEMVVIYLSCLKVNPY